MAKPSGPECNLNCDYCFYLEKNNFLEELRPLHMSDEVLEAYVSKYISSQKSSEIHFVWQGGEPLVSGIEFYERVIELQRKYRGDKTIFNSIQTNGTLLNTKWCEFLKSNNILIGISLDGPSFIHDKYRKNRNNEGTHSKVVKAIELLNKYKIEFNVLCCVTKFSSKHGREIYEYFRNLDVKHVQFTPIVERIPGISSEKLNLKHAIPSESEQLDFTEHTVIPELYGQFLIDVFDEWISNDVGKIFISNIESILPSWLGLENTMCIYSEKCGRSLVIEKNGDVYSCDHFVYPEYRLGNILDHEISDLMKKSKSCGFVDMKQGNLPVVCLTCRYLNICNGECPKNRITQGSNNIENLNYLCAGYKMFYKHIGRYMKAMAKLIANGMPASRVMELSEGPIVVVSR